MDECPAGRGRIRARLAHKSFASDSSRGLEMVHILMIYCLWVGTVSEAHMSSSLVSCLCVRS
jgi:hypothetical protein